MPRFEHSNFFKVNVANPNVGTPQWRAPRVFARIIFVEKPNCRFSCTRHEAVQPFGRPPRDAKRKRHSIPQSPTTSFLTAATLIYAIGAGITAAAGTRLALQLLLVKRFKLYSFQLQNPIGPCIVIYCHYLPVSGLGNLRACCLPWMW